MLTATDLAAMRATMEDALPDTAVIKTPTWVSDGGGGGTTTYTASGTADCRIAPLAAGEAVDGGRVHSDSEYVLTFPYDTAIADNSRITFDSRDFTITGMREPRSWELSRRVECREVD